MIRRIEARVTCLPFEFSTMDGSLETDRFGRFVLEYAQGVQEVVIDDLAAVLGQNWINRDGVPSTYPPYNSVSPLSS